LIDVPNIDTLASGSPQSFIPHIVRLFRIIEVGFTLVIVSLEARRLQEALKRSEHSDLKRHIELLGSQKFCHFLLNERHDQSLTIVFHPDGLIVFMNASASPLVAVLILRQILATDAHRGDATN
jgi:hypothetical protein